MLLWFYFYLLFIPYVCVHVHVCVYSMYAYVCCVWCGHTHISCYACGVTRTPGCLFFPPTLFQTGSLAIWTMSFQEISCLYISTSCRISGVMEMLPGCIQLYGGYVNQNTNHYSYTASKCIFLPYYSSKRP